MTTEAVPPVDVYDVLFINPAHHGRDYYSPIGINMLLALVREHGFHAGIIDFQREIVEGSISWPESFFPAAERRLDGIRARMYGFSVMNVGLPWAVRIARIIRRRQPDAVIVFGGPHATLLASDLLAEFPEIDVIALNEGENIIVPLVSAVVAGDLQALRSVPNLLLRDAGNTSHRTPPLGLIDDLDTLPLTDIDTELLANVGIISVEAGRGCPYRCTFCSSHALWTRKPRFKSPERLIDEAVRYLDATPEGDDRIVISYEHDDFLANAPLFRRFVACKRERERTFRYTITTRVNHISEEIGGLLASSGCVSVFMGLETGAEGLQLSSAKHLRLSDVLPRVRWLLSAGIHVSTNFIVGFPDETWDDIGQSVRMMLAICWLGGSVNISVMCPEPGSQLHMVTPRADYVLIRDSLYADEIARGGIDLDQLAEVERFHLTTIRNPNYEILEVARLARSLQFLMTEFPVSLSETVRIIGGDTSELLERVRAFQRARDRAICVENVGQFFASVITPAMRGGHAFELYLYEQARAEIKHVGYSVISPAVFGPSMPHAYGHALLALDMPT